MNTIRVAAALRALADAIVTPEEAVTFPEQPTATTKAPAQRGRGRPATGEDVPVAAPAQAPAAMEADPFAAPAEGVIDTSAIVPVATRDDCRAALQTLAAATTQQNAVSVLKKATGVTTLAQPLTAEQYGAAVVAARAATPAAGEVTAAGHEPTLEEVKAAITAAGKHVSESNLKSIVEQYGAVVAARAATPAAKQVEADPFTTTVEVTAAGHEPTLEEVKAAITAAGKHVSESNLKSIVVQHGGKGVGPDGVVTASLKALRVSQYAAVIAAIKALPKTK